MNDFIVIIQRGTGELQYAVLLQFVTYSGCRRPQLLGVVVLHGDFPRAISEVFRRHT
jgi:hypothetical protein